MNQYKKPIQFAFLLLSGAAFLLNAGHRPAGLKQTKGWVIAGSNPERYEMGVEPGSGRNGTTAASIASTSKKDNGFGTYMQLSNVGEFAGKRIRMKGWMKAQDVTGWAGFWLRIDYYYQGGNSILGFDNMKDGGIEDRSVKGTTDWKEYEIVLDVPEIATDLAFGALLSGKGKIWFDDIRMEVVGKDVPVTAKSAEPRPDISLESPANLDFEAP